jgi:hypothetical protein
MLNIDRTAVPEWSLLRVYRAPVNPEAWDFYQDCFTAEVARTVSLSEFIEAFYTGTAFRLERWILRFAVSKPSTDTDVRALAAGQAPTFSAWKVLQRTETQILLEDFQGRTRSWLAVRPAVNPAQTATLLHFGSGIAATTNPKSYTPELSRGFRWLAGFHIRYSEVLLHAARQNLTKVR